jgi:predicted dehydrogenase
MSRIRWGVLGAAKIAREHVIPAIQASHNGRVVALTSRNATKGAQACERAGIERLYADYESLIASAQIDAVYIPLPNTMHVEWTLRAIAAGKHVLCEKPIAMRAEEIDELITARDRSALTVGEAFMVAHHPQWEHVRALLASGRIGRLVMVEGSFTYNNRDPENIRNQAALGGGGLRDIGVYPIITARLATGREPIAAKARIERHPEFGTDRLAICHLDFGDFHMSFYCGTQAARRQQMTFHGENGWIRVEAPFNAGLYHVAHVQLRMNDSSVIEEAIFPQASQYQLMIENFGDAVQGKANLAFPLESSRANQRVLDMIFAAGKEN